MMSRQAWQVIIGLLGFVAMFVIRYRLVYMWWSKEGKLPVFSTAGLITHFPHKKEVVRIYQISDYLVPTLSFFIMIGFVYGLTLLPKWYIDHFTLATPGLLLISFLGLLELFRGVFTLVWGVDILYGFIVRRAEWQKYVVADQIKQLGILRIKAALVVMGILGISLFYK